MLLYQDLIRPWLFKIDPETIHEIVLRAGLPARCGAIKKCIATCCRCEDAALAVDVFGLHFPNPLGLAAGFDKNALALDLLSALGFGHIEVGTVTAVPQEGNPKPRIFRLPPDKALINRMGFPSDGMELVGQRLTAALTRGGDSIIGVNIGKGRATPVDEASADYLRLFAQLRERGDYFVVNVSSPNTPDLRRLQERARLEALLKAIQAINTEGKPLLVKLAPDLSWQEIDEALEAAMAAGVAGIIATNTTISRAGLSSSTEETGGLSGPPVRQRALEVVSYIYQRSEGKLPIIGVGGINTAVDVWNMIACGASLVQIYTGFIYEGPLCVMRIKQGLLRMMKDAGVGNISELIGLGAQDFLRQAQDGASSAPNNCHDSTGR